MNGGPLLARTVVQNAWLVDDLDDGMARWSDAFGIDRWFVNRDIAVDDARYRGTPTDLRFAGALAQAGGVQLELICQLDDSPSCYRDLYEPGTEGFHHVAVFASDFDAEMQRWAERGLDVAFSGVSRTMRFAYVDTSATLGFMVEVLEDVPEIRKRFAEIAAAQPS